jgi:hypothetical protein
MHAAWLDAPLVSIETSHLRRFNCVALQIVTFPVATRIPPTHTHAGHIRASNELMTRYSSEID